MKRPTTPTTISPAIIKMCEEIVDNPQPQYLTVEPVAGAQVKDCFEVVAKHVHGKGGSVCYGWQIWEWPVLIEAEFHAVWKDNGGALHDITPKEIPTKRILFLPDSKRTYVNMQVNNIRRPLSDAAEVKDFIDACNAEFELMNRGARAHQHGDIVLSGADLEEHIDIQYRKANAQAKIEAGLRKHKRKKLAAPNW